MPPGDSTCFGALLQVRSEALAATFMENEMTKLLSAVTIAALMLVAAPASAQITASKESLSDLYTGKV